MKSEDFKLLLQDKTFMPKLFWDYKKAYEYISKTTTKIVIQEMNTGEFVEIDQSNFDRFEHNLDYLPGPTRALHQTLIETINTMTERYNDVITNLSWRVLQFPRPVKCKIRWWKLSSWKEWRKHRNYLQAICSYNEYDENMLNVSVFGWQERLLQSLTINTEEGVPRNILVRF